MDRLYTLTSFQMFVVFGWSFLFGCAGHYLGKDFANRSKLFFISFLSCLLVSLLGRIYF